MGVAAAAVRLLSSESASGSAEGTAETWRIEVEVGDRVFRNRYRSRADGSSECQIVADAATGRVRCARCDWELPRHHVEDLERDLAAHSVPSLAVAGARGGEVPSNAQAGARSSRRRRELRSCLATEPLARGG